jgi:hypothetical protein
MVKNTSKVDADLNPLIHYTKIMVQDYRLYGGDGITVEEIIPKAGYDINKIRLHHIAHWELYHLPMYAGYCSEFGPIDHWDSVWTNQVQYFINAFYRDYNENIYNRNRYKVQISDLRKDNKFTGAVKRGYMQENSNGIDAIVQVYDTNQIFYIRGVWS